MNASVTIKRKVFLEALRQIVKLGGRRKDGVAVIYREGGELCIEALGVGVCVPFEGSWQGGARISLRFMHALSRVPPAQDPVPISMRGGKLFIGTTGIPCEWQDILPAPTVEIPINASLLDILVLRSRYREPVLINSGILANIAAAEAEVNGLLAKAARILEPVGITQADLWAIVRYRIKGKPTVETTANSDGLPDRRK